MSVNVSPDDPFYGVGKVAAMFGVEPATIRLWIREGKMNAHKIGNRWRIQHSEVVRVANEEHK